MANPFRSSRRGVLENLRCLLVAACAASCLPAWATDLVAAKPPVEITDGEVSIGPRTLHLPPGRWFYVDHQEKQVTGSGYARAPSVDDTAFLLRVEHGEATLAVRLGLLRSDLVAPSWNFTCLAPGTIYFKDRTAVPGSADCLHVGDRRDARSAIEGWSPTGAAWLAAQGITPTGALVFVRYHRFGPNSHGMIALLIPTEHFESETAVSAWAESLRDALKPWFEHRSSQASLPPLPEPAPETSSGGAAPSEPGAQAASAPSSP